MARAGRGVAGTPPEVVSAPDISPVVPVAAAGLVLVRPDNTVLMVRRPATARFAPNAWVFPGGLVETHDGLADCAVPVEQALDEDGLRPYRVAAVRECLEETGLACVGARPSSEQREQARQALHRGAPFWSTMEALVPGAVLSPLHYVSFWTTPSLSPLRYSTRFFMTAAPDHQGAGEVDGEELTEARWVRPEHALAAHRDGRFLLLPPQLAQLRQYAAVVASNHLVEWAAAGPLVVPNGG